MWHNKGIMELPRKRRIHGLPNHRWKTQTRRNYNRNIALHRSTAQLLDGARWSGCVLTLFFFFFVIVVVCLFFCFFCLFFFFFFFFCCCCSGAKCALNHNKGTFQIHAKFGPRKGSLNHRWINTELSIN